VTDHACPGDDILAAFAEGTLPREQRVKIERHVANCAECPVVIGDVIRFLAESTDRVHEDAVSATVYGRWWFIAAAIAAICVPIAIRQTMTSHDPLREVRRIAAGQAERLYEGRLYGLPHARFRSPRGGENGSVPIELRAESERLAKLGNNAEVLHARALAALLSADPREAARLLNGASQFAPNDTAIWNDLAVAEIARAGLGDGSAATSALNAADHAIALAPSIPDAHYNRALALEQLGRDREAADAFRQALAHERSDAWRAEIRGRLQRLANGR
jgi:tetratricopeptide (TPR) repeat protein